MPADDRWAVETLRQAYARWVDLDDRVLALSSETRQGEAYELAREHAEDPVSWEDLIAKLVAANEVRLGDQVAAAGVAYRKGRSVLLAAALASTLVALVAGTMVFLGIQRIMKDLVALNSNLESLVERRTKELRSREESMRLMLDNVSDGFFTVDREGRVSAERSAAADRWFGAAEGVVHLWEYLGRLDSRIADWTKLGFDQILAEELPFEVTVEQMPARFESDGAIFTVEYMPLRGADRLSGLLVVVRDITKQVESERTEAEQRELTRMVQRIVRDKTGFLDFLAESHEMVGRLLARAPSAEESLRLVHTLKGNCAVYGILSVSDLCNAIEARCAEQGCGVSPEDARDIGRMWEGITAKVRELVAGSGPQSIEMMTTNTGPSFGRFSRAPRAETCSNESSRGGSNRLEFVSSGSPLKRTTSPSGSARLRSSSTSRTTVFACPRRDGRTSGPRRFTSCATRSTMGSRRRKSARRSARDLAASGFAPSSKMRASCSSARTTDRESTGLRLKHEGARSGFLHRHTKTSSHCCSGMDSPRAMRRRLRPGAESGWPRFATRARS